MKEFIYKLSGLESHFTILSNETLQDPNLSWGAKGLITYLNSLPPSWKLCKKHLAKHYAGDQKGNGESAIDSLVLELRNAGYILYNKKHKENGQFDYVYIVLPMQKDKYQKMFPEPFQRALVEAGLVEQGTIKKTRRERKEGERLSVTDGLDAPPCEKEDLDEAVSEGSPEIREIKFKTRGGKIETLRLQDVIQKVILKRFDCETRHIQEAFEALEKSESLIYDWWAFIKGTIEKLKVRDKSQRIEKACKKKSTKTSKSNSSEEDTAELASPKSRGKRVKFDASWLS